MSGVDALAGSPELQRRMEGRWFGLYRAVVKDNDDPRRLGRIKVICESVYGDAVSPWALPCALFAGLDEGAVLIPPANTPVWIQFEEGDPASPVWLGGFWLEKTAGRPYDGSPIEATPEVQNSASAIPLHAQGFPDGTDEGGGPKGVRGAPKSTYAGKYPNVRLIKTPSGHSIELDDTPGAERVMVSHSTGAHVEIVSDGTINIISTGQVRTVAKKADERVAGHKNVEVEGDLTQRVRGSYKMVVDGAYEVTYSRGLTQTLPSEVKVVKGDKKYDVSGSMVLKAANNISITAGASYSLGVGRDMTVNALGFGNFSFMNAEKAAQPDSVGLLMEGSGRAKFQAIEPTGLLAKTGIEMQSLGTATRTVTPIAGDIGPFVKIGNLLVPFAGAVPLLAEPVVLGSQLQQFLNALMTILNSLVMDYIAHFHAPWSPSVSAGVTGSSVIAQLATIQGAYLQPMSPAVPGALILSDTVFVTK